MSWMKKHEAIERVLSATPESPLAVFRVDADAQAKPGHVDVVFFNTWTAQERPTNSRIGVFHRASTNLNKLRELEA